MNTAHWYQLNWLDFVIIAVILFSIIVSFFRGFLRESISLVTWVLAVIIALKFAAPLGNELSTHIESASLRFVIGFVALFLGVIVVGLMVNLMIKFLVEKTGISLFDRMLGVLFGTVRGILFVAIVLMILNLTELQDASWMKNSKLATQFQPLVSWLCTFVPKKLNNMSKWITDEGFKI